MYFGNYHFYRLNRVLLFIRKLLMVIIVSAFILCIICIVISYANRVGKNISDGVVRLHVIPNSNSQTDQELKLEVRDAVIKHLEERITDNIENADQMFSYLNSDLSAIREVAEEVVRENGYTYNVETATGNFLFPEKNYGTFSLPSGDYRALRIIIGEGTGNNWWCILFPPLCFTGTAVNDNQDSDDALAEAVGDEGYKIISGASKDKPAGVRVKFKIVEFIGRIHNMISSRINISGKK